MKRTLLATTLLGLAMNSIQAAPGAGALELVFGTANGSISSNENADVVSLAIRPAWFLTQRHQLGGVLGYRYINSDFGGSNSNWDIGLLYRYNVVDSEDTEWFYLGAEVVDADATAGIDGRVFYPHVGWKSMLSEDIAFDINAGRAMPDADFYQDTTVVEFGVSVFF